MSLLCWKCGRECDAWTESFWNDEQDRYVGYCRRCQRTDLAIQEAIALRIRLALELAYARIPKKRKPVAA
jgi:hypothetical protein